MEHWDTITAERLALADQLDDLTPEQWATPSLCGAWTVHALVGHLVVPHVVPTLKAGLEILKHRGSFPRANAAMALAQAQRSPADLVADLRTHAGGHFKPPGFSSVAPLSDVLIHGQDLRVPLGLADERPVDPWAHTLEFLTSRRAAQGFLPRRLPALRFEASDLDWSGGSGTDLVRGPAAALGLTMAGRGARSGELEGPGVPTLVAWAAG